MCKWQRSKRLQILPSLLYEMKKEFFLERIFDGLSLGAKERGFGADSVRKYEDSETKIYLPQVRNLARPVLGLARPCHTPELLLLLLLRF
ncbi:hypothetical protein MTR_2g460960 [Medicago truncatula]|uniref:Uncharacterized protein n=1 Tax=Medicago truncatula TaxID=3880 RepID=A0A072V8X7_MEDTR|nr:hypothetical protein MTR_2g460960 [Medicago truncatula]